MLAALIIVFREIFEAGLIIGIVLAVTRTIAHRGWWVAGGVAGGTLGACVVAVFAGALSAAFDGVGQELFYAAILGVAVVMLTWHIVWMARHGRELAAQMRAVGEAVVAGSKSLVGLSVVVGVAVLREGVEVVLFLYGVAASGAGSNVELLAGGFAGLLLGGLVCALTYVGLLNIPSRYLFGVTNVMIALLAAGMAAQATAFLERANVVTILGSIVWDTSWMLTEKSLVGRALHTLIGYTDQPTAMELLVYLATLGAIFGLMKLVTSIGGAARQARPVY
ncbi:MAG: FTR1 family protein [Proteobacteria bacterium]|nr:FTR1 family protein [Pseudomonadota bacterium]